MFIDHLLPQEIVKNGGQSLRSARQFFGISTFGFLIAVYYIYKFNFVFHYSDANPIFFLLLAGTPIAFFVLFKTRKIEWASWIFFPCAAGMIGTMFYVGGGINAPGAFWTVSIPFVGSFLLGRRGFLFGMWFSFFLLLFASLFTDPGYYPNIPLISDRLAQDRSQSLFVYFVLNMVFLWLHNRSIDDYTKWIEDKTVEVENLLRVLVHDIASPITVIEVKVAKLLKTNSDPELVKVRTAAANITSQIRQIREIRAVLDHKSELKLTSVGLVEAIRESIELNLSKLEAKNIKLETVYPEQEVQVMASPTVLKNQVISNIISNAIKFSPSDSRLVVSVRVSNETPHLVELEIRDFGIGMPKEILDNIFRMDVKTTRAGTAGEKGTGYGMPLMKFYLNKMNAEVFVQSKEAPAGQATDAASETGTSFKLVLAKAS